MDINMIPGLRPSQSPPAASKSAAKSKKSDSKAPSSPQIDTFESTASKPWGNHMISGSSGKLHGITFIHSKSPLIYSVERPKPLKKQPDIACPPGSLFRSLGKNSTVCIV